MWIFTYYGLQIKNAYRRREIPVVELLSIFDKIWIWKLQTEISLRYWTTNMSTKPGREKLIQSESISKPKNCRCLYRERDRHLPWKVYRNICPYKHLWASRTLKQVTSPARPYYATATTGTAPQWMKLVNGPCKTPPTAPVEGPWSDNIHEGSF